MRQRILCAVQRHELGAVTIHRFVDGLFINALGCPGFHVKVAPQNAAAVQVRLESKLRRHKLGTSKRTNAVTSHTVKEKNHNHFAELLRKQAMSK